MKIKQYLVIFLSIFFFPNVLFGRPFGEIEKHDRLPQGYYISINPLSLFAFIPSVATKEYLLPYLYNLESGLSVAGGYYFNKLQLEGRVVLGSPSTLIFSPQLHAGIRYFPFTNKDNNAIPFGFGFFIRSWDLYYKHSELHFINIAPHLNICYLIKRDKFFYDFRVGWDFAVATWSNLEHSSPKAALTSFPPTFSINIGYNF